MFMSNTDDRDRLLASVSCCMGLPSPQIRRATAPPLADALMVRSVSDSSYTGHYFVSRYRLVLNGYDIVAKEIYDRYRNIG